ncbi:MAG: phosphoesterase [Atopobiaceae bacterium]|nr:phosphoesterase [Atopobiaceae bacterium]
MRDIHCHILPGVDDGARDMDMSLDMLEAAQQAGVTSIICTPHCREPYFDYDAMWDAYEDLVAHAGGFPLTMGFEVNWNKLMDLGFDEWAPYLGLQCESFAGPNKATFLLELSSSASSSQYGAYKQTIFELQGMGYDVIVAHPERYGAIQRHIDLAQGFKDMGCKLQASADFIAGGRLGNEKKPAKAMFKAGLYDYIASDAHKPEHYEMLAKACRKFMPGGGTEHL